MHSVVRFCGHTPIVAELCPAVSIGSLLFGFLWAACWAVNACADPLEFFQMYRQRTFSLAGEDARRVFVPWNALLTSSGNALVLISLCRLLNRALEFARQRAERGLRIFTENSNSEEGAF